VKHKASLQSSHFMVGFMLSPLPPCLLFHQQRKKSTLFSIQSGECIPGTFQQRGREVCFITSLVGSGGKEDCILYIWTTSLAYSKWTSAGLKGTIISDVDSCSRLSWRCQLSAHACIQGMLYIRSQMYLYFRISAIGTF